MKHLSRIHPQRTGFTLVELLVSIGIVATLLGVGIPAFRSYGSLNALDDAAGSVQTNILQAHNLALAPLATNPKACTPSAGQDCKIHYYGVAFTSGSDSYTLVQGYTPTTQVGQDNILVEYQLPSLIHFDAVPAEPIWYSVDEQGEPVMSQNVTIQLSHERVTQTRTLTVNRNTGQVTVN